MSEEQGGIRQCGRCNNPLELRCFKVTDGVRSQVCRRCEFEIQASEKAGMSATSHDVVPDGVDPASLVPSPRSGVVPPVAHRFKKGNPGGRRPIGSSVRDWMNILQGASRATLEKIAKRPGRGSAKVIAAVRVLRAMEHPDVADYDAITEEGLTAAQARAKGINTAPIKRVKVKRRTIEREGQEPIVEIEREIELRDTALQESEFVTNQTGGTPTKTINVQGGADLAPPQIIVRMVGDDDDSPKPIDAEVIERKELPEGVE